MELVFYITGHGYGHATRCLEVIKCILQHDRNSTVHVRSNASKWLFDKYPQNCFYHYARTLDVGLIQKNSFKVNKKETLKVMLLLYAERKTLIKQELDFLKKNKIDAIVADIPPLAFDVAQKAGIPSFGMTNFSWDWIYSAFTDDLPEYWRLIENIQQSYSKASNLLRLPFHGDLSAFPRRMDVPLVVRKPINSKKDTLEKLRFSLNDHRPIVLVGLREPDLLSVNLKQIGQMTNYRFITFNLLNPPPNALNLQSRNYYFPDLLNACDLVISKPGYGIVSEVISIKTPMLYIPRSDFIEYDILVAALQKFHVAEELPTSNFLTGEWQPFIDSVLSKEMHNSLIRDDGADVVARTILDSNITLTENQVKPCKSDLL